MLIRFLMFGVLGVFGAAVASCVGRIVATKKIAFSGEASLLLFPCWGLIAFFYPLIGIRLGSVPWYGRGLIYTVVFYVFQFLIGWGLTRINLCPWKYSGGTSFMGLVRLADAPAFFIAGLVVEWVYPYVKAAAAFTAGGI